VADLAAEQPGQERLDQRLLHVQALDHVQDGAAGEQAHRRHPGGPVPAPQPAGQQQPDPSGGHGNGGPSRHRAGNQVGQQPHPVPLGREQRRDEVDAAGQDGHGGGQTRHPRALGE
jgi:hypothetical protein